MGQYKLSESDDAYMEVFKIESHDCGIIKSNDKIYNYVDQEVFFAPNFKTNKYLFKEI